MSVPNKSLDKNKRFTGVKPNDFINKTRANDVNRSNIRPQGWANLGKVNSRRIPPPANVPSLKSEIGCQSPVYDPTVPVNHGWSSTIPSNDNAPTQQQLDALPVHSSTPATPGTPPTLSAFHSAEIDKSRSPPTWSSVTSGSTNVESIPNLLGLNDFPRLTASTQEQQQQQRRTSPNEINPTFRPANLATWKEGGANPNRIPSLMSDVPVQLMSPNNSNRNYSTSPMWAYPPQSSRLSNITDYKSPRILRHKDIDELSKLTDNTWANASEEINYEEKIRFSDDEETTDAAVPLKTSSIDPSLKTRRVAHPLSHSRFIQDDEHLKQMQDDKNSELISALTIAKQRRDEQERHLKKKSHEDQENVENSTTDINKASRTRHDTANSQTFSMKSWSDQMDSFNYASLHEKSTNVADRDEVPVSIEFHRSASESSSTSHQESNSRQMKARKVKTRLIQSKQYQQNLENSSPRNDSMNEQSTRRTNTKKTTGYPEQQIYRPKQSTMKTRNNGDRTQSRQDSTEIKGKSNRNGQAWRPLSPPRSTGESIEPTGHESTNYKSQSRHSNTNEHKTRYPISSTAHIDTSSIPPLMSVCSDPTTTAHLFKTNAPTSNSAHYSQRQEFYHENQHEQTHQRYPQPNRGYTALGSYGRYRRGGGTMTTHRPTSQQQQQQQQQQQDYSVYPSGGQTKKNGHRKSTEFAKTLIDDGVISPLMSKSIESPLNDLTIEPLSNKNDQQESNLNDSNENQSKTKLGNGSNGKRRTNREPLTFYQAQQAPRHRNNYPRAMQDYESLPTQHYYNNSRRNPTMQDTSSSGYYYEHPQQQNYNQSQYNNFPCESSQSVRVQPKKHSKRGGTTPSTHQRAVKTRLNNGNHHRHHSTSDNDPKEGEEWETASESSTNMRNGHQDNHHPHSSTATTSTNHRGRTPPQKSFSSQRQHARQIFKYTNA